MVCQFEEISILRLCHPSWIKEHNFKKESLKKNMLLIR